MIRTAPRLALPILFVSLLLSGWPAPGALARDLPFAFYSTAASSGWYHTCTLTTTGGVKCWGRNDDGQLGNSSWAHSQVPVDVWTAAGNSAPLSGVVAIALGSYHTCALTDAGGVTCWGYNSYGQLGDGSWTARNTPVDVSGLGSGVVAITAGNSFTCALTTTGAVKCWGLNSFGALGNGSTTNSNVPVDVSGLSSGVRAIAAGGYHACALTGSGLKCWGYNNLGQLGNNTTTDSHVPTDVWSGTGNPTALAGVAGFAAGTYHTCVATTGGGAKCWGYSNYGQLGSNSWGLSSVPVDVWTGAGNSTPLSGVAAVTAGEHHTCAVMATGGLRCWGSAEQSQMGSSPTTPVAVDMTDLTAGVRAAAAGKYHTCVTTTSGAVRCVGGNSYGALGNGSTVNSASPVDPIRPTSGSTSAIAAGYFASCAVTASGGVKCWGRNDYGQLGDGSTTERLAPVDVWSGSGNPTPLSGARSVSTGYRHTCALIASGGVTCWGSNVFGQLGSGTGTSFTPVDVSGLTSGTTAVGVGEFHSCALTSAGGVKCWGNNQHGQLGDGTTTTRITPVDVSGLTSGVSAIAVGYNSTCALLSSGNVKCWGRNHHGQLGNGSTTGSDVPVDVVTSAVDPTPLSGASALDAGLYHACVATTSGGARCWGWNFYGQLGDDTTVERHAPVDVSGLTSVRTVSAGAFGTCILTTAGGAKCWGWNLDGQVGDGSTTDRHTPVDVIGLSTGLSTISAGYEHVCALTASGGAKCWGDNGAGALGNGSMTTSHVPIQVLGLLSSALPSVQLASNPMPAGQAANLSATVGSVVDPPSGTVQFRVDGVDLGGPVSLVGGSATGPSTGAIGVGLHRVSATYGGDPNYGASRSAATVLEVVEPLAAPSIAKSFGAASLLLNDATALELVVTNPNAAALTGVAVTDALPAGLVVADPPAASNGCGGTFAPAAGASSVVLSGGTVAAGGSCTFRVNVTGTSLGTKHNTTGNVTSNEGGAGNTASASVDVVAADLAMTMSASPDPVTVGDDIVYTIDLINAGTAPALSVAVSDATPASTTFVSAAVTTGSGWLTSAPAVGATGAVLFTKTEVLAGEAAVFEVRVRVDPATPGGTTISNTATISTTTIDPVSGNDVASTATTVTPCVAAITVVNASDAGAGSLRQAIAGVCAGGTIDFAGDLTIRLASQLVLDKDLTIDGTGHSVIVSGDTNDDGAGDVRVFDVRSGVVATLAHLTIVRGTVGGGFACAAGNCGGGIYNRGTLTLSTSTVSNCSGLYGGGIYNQGAMTVTDGTLDNNHADYGGGAIYNVGTLTVSRSTLSGNSTGYGGGAILNDGGALSVTTSTFSANSAGAGGAIANDSGTALKVHHSTLSGNSAPNGGGGILTYGTWLDLSHTIIANSPAGGDCVLIGGAGSWASAGYSLIESTGAAACGLTTDYSTVLGVDPLLGPLGNHGGSTQTFPLLPGSPAIDAGQANDCPADQRGVSRPQGARCDIGAFESQGFTLTVSGGDDQHALVHTAFADPLQVTLTEAGGNSLPGAIITFTPPGAGASAILSSATAVTDGSGVAGVTATANGTGGPYNVIASANGAASASFTLTNERAPATVTLGDLIQTYDGTPRAVSVTTNPAGVSVTVTYTGAGGTAYGPSTAPPVNAGTYDVVAAVNDPGYEGGATAALVVGAATTWTTLTSGANPSLYGQAVLLTVSVSPAPTGGTVTVRADGSVIAGCASQPLTGGQATCSTASLSVGAHAMTAEYTGDGNHLPSSGSLAPDQLVMKGSTTTTLSGPATPVGIGAAVHLTATVTAIAPSTGTPSGSVSFADGPTTLCADVPLDAAATATCDTIAAAPLGNHSLTAVFAGGPSWEPSMGGFVLTVAGQAPAITSGASAAFTVGTPGQFLVTSIGTPTPALSSAGALPAGLGFQDNGDGTASLSGTALYGQGGTYLVTIRAANGAGPDAVQDLTLSVASVTMFSGPTATGTGIATAQISGGGATCTFMDDAAFVSITSVSAPAPASFPHGLFSFVLRGCTGPVTMTITYPSALPGGTAYWKLGPASRGAAPSWYQFVPPTTAPTSLFTLTLEDDTLGDDDWDATTDIVDQGGPGVPYASIPALGTAGLVTLVMLLAFGALAVLRRHAA